MSTKKLIFAAVAALAFAISAKAQTNVQTFYDFGKDRNYVTTTFEMFKGDKFGDTFFFIDHYYTSKDQRPAAASAINGSYFEIERGINFWQESSLKDLSAHVEYDGTTWGQGTWCFGAKYFLHSQDYSNMLTLYAMYETFRGFGSADIPLKFTAVWSMGNLFSVKGLTFKGFADLWGNNCVWTDGTTTKWTFLTEPQLWMNLGSLFDGHLDIGGEVELSYNFAGNKGFMCNPCAGLRWTF